MSFKLTVYSSKVNPMMLDFSDFSLSQSSAHDKGWIKKDKSITRGAIKPKQTGLVNNAHMVFK